MKILIQEMLIVICMFWSGISYTDTLRDTYYEKMSRAPDGTVIFIENGILYRPIEAFTGSTFSHCAIIIYGNVYEATPPAVRKMSTNEYAEYLSKRHTKRPLTRVVFVEPPLPFSSTILQKMLKYAQGKIGTPYKLSTYWNRNQKIGMHCAQYVGNILQESGRINSNDNKETPGSLYKKLIEISYADK